MHGESSYSWDCLPAPASTQLPHHQNLQSYRNIFPSQHFIFGSFFLQILSSSSFSTSSRGSAPQLFLLCWIHTQLPGLFSFQTRLKNPSCWLSASFFLKLIFQIKQITHVFSKLSGIKALLKEVGWGWASHCIHRKSPQTSSPQPQLG